MNAVVERKRPLTALLVTDGFRDILSIRDEHRYEMFDSHRISQTAGFARDDVRHGRTCAPKRRGAQAARYRTGVSYGRRRANIDFI
jgi:N-methylhydantoinase A/oxoprolinase/acetone carboxylase beta subunit